MLRLYNTMTRSVDDFTPIEQGKVGLYTCGPTVYNYAHIGNLRTYVFEDILKRALLVEGFDVNHVMNVTDVGHLVSDADEGEDKMELGARREGKTVREIAEFYFQAFRRDMERLNLLEPNIWCKATEHIPEQIELVRKLVEKGFTYTIDDGVYFDTSKLADYGKLARLDVEGLRAGARIEMVAGKRAPTDFALWKFSPKGPRRLMEWESPWGVGFPGWHIECTAMSMKYLGEHFDIHCGGIDHIAVHHTNEIAQAESATGVKWVNWWMHAAFLTMVAAERMAKSSGNFVTLDTAVERGFDPLTYRYYCLNAHYRSPLAFSWEGMESAANALDRLTNRVIEIKSASSADASPLDRWMGEFSDAVRDDLNMPRALAAMWGLLKDSDRPAEEVHSTLLEMDKVLGLGVAGMQAAESAIPDDVRRLVDARREARERRDFEAADRIRDEILAKGYLLEDTPEGPKIKGSPPGTGE